MRSFDIDRLTLELPSGVANDPRTMALEIVAGLASAGALPAAGDYPVVRVQVPAGLGDRGSDLRRRVITEALRQLRRGNG